MEEEEIRKTKPSATLYVLLFIFYTIWVLQTLSAASFYFTFGFGELGGNGLRGWLFVPVFCIGGLLCLYAVIKALRGDSDCITALKWALGYSFLYTLLNGPSTPAATMGFWTLLTTFLIRPLFYLIFYLYLCCSKGIKMRYPKPGRRFAPSGWAWVGITACLVGLVAWGGYEAYYEYQFCKRVDVQSVALEEGEFSDGYVAFKSQLAWTPTQEMSDTINIDHEKVLCYQTLEAYDSLSTFYLFSGTSDMSDVRTHNQIITYLLADSDDMYAVEVAHRDTIVGDKYLVSTSFLSHPDDEPWYVTVATVFHTGTPKCIVLLSVSEAEDGRPWVDDIVSTLEWDLQNIAKAKHQENTHHDQEEIAQRVGQYHHQANADVLGRFLDRRTPRFLFGEMLLEHHKREIAGRQGYEPFD